LSWHIHRLIVHQHNVVFLHVALQQGVHVEVQLKNEIGKNELELEEKRRKSWETYESNFEHHRFAFDPNVHVNIWMGKWELMVKLKCL
jgi:hypothetical protein